MPEQSAQRRSRPSRRVCRRSIRPPAPHSPSGVPPWLLDLLIRYPWLPYAVLALAVVLALILLIALPAPAGVLAAVVVGGALLAAYFLLRQWQTAAAPGANMAENGQIPSSVDNLPKNPNFVLSDPDSTLRPSPGASDSPTAVRFKTALRDWYTLQTAGKAAAQRPAPVALDFAGATSALVAAVDPRSAIPRRGLVHDRVRHGFGRSIGADFNEVMAYPKIDLPMYEPLKDISIELLLPNINLIPPNSITLIETNQKFIEAYMVGLNHEFARKLLWRGYPTDQRGSYFRQFWDVRSYIDSEGSERRSA